MILTAGARLGPYEITGALGQGGMGEVYCARDTALERDVAIKILPPAFAADSDRIARFEPEAAPFRVYAPTAGRVDEPVFSPDSKWVAFHSNESGSFEVYVTRFPPTGSGERWPVSANGGVQPQWNRNGRELFFLAPDGTLMAVDVRLGETPTFGIPQPLFRSFVPPSANVDTYATMPDGSRFLMVLPAATDETLETHVILNWPALLDDAPTP